MKQRLFAIGCLLSVFAAVFVVSAWALSYWRVAGVRYHHGSLEFGYTRPGKCGEVLSLQGYLVFTHWNTAERNVHPIKWEWIWTPELWRTARVPEQRWDWLEQWRIGGLRFHLETEKDVQQGLIVIAPFWAISISVPYWCALLVSGVLPTVCAIAHLRKRRRMHRGLCLNCGYDLRATPDRCPECGTIVTAGGPGNLSIE